MRARPHRLRTPRTPPGSKDPRRGPRRRASPLTAEDLAALDRETLAVVNALRAEERRQRYAEDPLWRLSKLKDNRERRARQKRAEEVETFIGARYRSARRIFLERAAARNFSRAANSPVALLSGRR